MAEGQGSRESNATAALGFYPVDLFDDLREPMEAAALSCLATTLEKAADALFDRAYREHRAAIRDSCHAAVRALHRDRAAITRRFRETLDASLERAFGVARDDPWAERDYVNRDRAIVEATAERVRRQHDGALAEVYQCLAPVVAVADGGDGHPFGPETLVRAFAEALAATDIELRPRLLIYRMFENALIESLGSVLEELKAAFNAAGLTPDKSGTGSSAVVALGPSCQAAGATAAKPTSAAGEDAGLTQAEDRQTPSGPSRAPSKRVAAVRRAVTEAVEAQVNAKPEVGEAPVRFLRQAWFNVMLITGIKYGVGGELWCHQCRLMEWLLRSFQPPSAEKARRRLDNQLPALLRRLRVELITVMRDHDVADRLIDPLRRAHAAGIESSDEAAGLLEPDGGVGRGAGSSPNNVVQARFDKQAADRSRTTNELKRALALMPLCSWFSLAASEGQREIACLQARAEGGQRYIFADRHGFRVAEYGLTELAQAVRRGTATPVDDNALGMNAEVPRDSDRSGLSQP